MTDPDRIEQLERKLQDLMDRTKALEQRDRNCRGALQNMHNITTHTCEIDGNVAHAESYVIGLFLNADGKTARLLAGRYASRLTRRRRIDGEGHLRQVEVEAIEDPLEVVNASCAAAHQRAKPRTHVSPHAR